MVQLDASPRLIQAVDRAIRLLKAVAESPHRLTIVEAARACGVNRSTAWRLMATLEHHGLVERDPVSQRYAVGYGALAISGAALEQGALVRRLRPRLAALAATTQETVNLSVATSTSVVCVDQIDGPSVVTLNWLGRPLPLHSSSNGKALLAYMSPAEVEAYLQRPLQRSTPFTITDPEELRRELGRIRRQGYAIAIGELEEGFNGVSAPVLDSRQRPIAFVSVSGLAPRLPEERLHDLGALARETARGMARDLEAPAEADVEPVLTGDEGGPP